MTDVLITTGVYSIDKIKTQAREAAAKYTDVNDACPYPFQTTAGHIFREEFLWVRSVIEQKEPQA
jgi:hypothetical protein